MLTTFEIARRCGVSTNTISDWRRKGRIRAHAINDRNHFSLKIPDPIHPRSTLEEFQNGRHFTRIGRRKVDSVFLLWHVHHIADGNDDEKLIGVYRTEDEAGAAISRLRDKPGFSQTPDGFQIVSYTLNEDHWTEGYVSA
jgi:hypothetical protein